MAGIAENKMTPAEELQWYFDQAEAGDERAMRELGRMHLQGFTHPDDPEVEIQPDADGAISFLSRAIELGDGDAAMLLGQLYDGEPAGGFFDEPEEAFLRYQQAVDLGSELGRFYLASRYLIGRGVERDEQKGREMMIEAAYRGVIDAQNFLGAIYRKSGDESLAAVWEVVAAVFDKEFEHAGTKKDLSLCKEDLERVRLTLQRVKAYMLLCDCDDPQLMQLADQMRENFFQEIV